MVMQVLEVLGMITLVGLLFTAESKNHGVSQVITAIGNANTGLVKGIGPG